MNDFNKMLSKAPTVTKAKEVPQHEKPIKTKRDKMILVSVTPDEKKMIKALKDHYNFNSEAETMRFLMKDALRRTGVMI